MYMCLLTFFVMISCMCLAGGVNWVGAGFDIHFVWWGIGVGVLGFSNLYKLLVWGCAW